VAAKGSLNRDISIMVRGLKENPASYGNLSWNRLSNQFPQWNALAKDENLISRRIVLTAIVMRDINNSPEERRAKRLKRRHEGQDSKDSQDTKDSNHPLDQ